MDKRVGCSLLVTLTTACSQQTNLPSTDEAAIIASAYARLSYYAHPSPLGVDIRMVRHVPREEFDLVAYAELVSMPGGSSIDVIQEIHGELDGEETVRYRLSWADDVDEAPPQLHASVATNLGVAALEEPELGRARSLSAYEVTVTLDGRRLTYKAAALWIPDDEGHLRVRFIDFVLGDPARAAGETRPLRRERADAALRVQQPVDIQPAPAACVPSTVTTARTPFSIEDDEEHILGGHRARMRYQAQCSCSSTCASTCTPIADPSPVCKDDGDVAPIVIPSIIPRFHAKAKAVKYEPGAHLGGEGASCAAGLGCGIRSCLAIPCSLGISTSVSGGVISFSFSASPLIDMSSSMRFTCDDCTPGGGDPPGPYCGNASCDPGESTCSCPSDCPGPCCGNGVCQPGESCNSCPSDCPFGCVPVCGDGTCEPVERNEGTCCLDCGCFPPDTCDNNVCVCTEIIDGDCGIVDSNCHGSLDLGSCGKGFACIDNHCAEQDAQ